MCLIYHGNAVKHKEPFKAYKVYAVCCGVNDSRYLRSPYKPLLPSGSIKKGGEIVASLNEYAYVFLNADAADPHTLPLTDVHIGQVVDVAGLHCIANEEDAKAFKLAVTNRCNYSFLYPPVAMVVVEVTIDPNDVIMFGDTPIGYWTVEGVNTLDRKQKIATIVTRRLTLSAEEFDKAVNVNPVN